MREFRASRENMSKVFSTENLHSTPILNPIVEVIFFNKGNRE